MEAVSDSLRFAIQEGAPLYNKGRSGECYNVYNTTAESIIKMSVTPQEVVAALEAALEAAYKEPSDNEKAWIMRRAFDSILDGSVTAHARLAAIPSGAEDFLVLDFQAGLPPNPRWFVLDDNVMGGVSHSSLSYDPSEEAASFSGNLSVEYNGGFASVRSRPWGGLTFGHAKGVRMMVKGDGRHYKLNAKPDDAFDGLMYQHDFPTTNATWEQVDLPFTNFKPNFRGRVVPNQPPLVGSQIRQLGLMVSKFSDSGGLTPGFRSGPFKLSIRWMRGVL